MAAYSYPTITDIDENGIPFARPGLRQRLASAKFMKYNLEYDPATIIPGGVLETMAGRVFGRHQQWYILADVNKLRDPSAWSFGDIITIPLDIV